jgi:hypothetical protein
VYEMPIYRFGLVPLAQVAENFKLTSREQDVLQYLSEGGLTRRR